MRRADRAVTDRARILQVIESCECCRVGFSCPEGAYIVPLNFAFVPGTPDRFYFHGAHEGRKAELIRTAPHNAAIHRMVREEIEEYAFVAATYQQWKRRHGAEK